MTIRDNALILGGWVTLCLSSGLLMKLAAQALSF
ncbi:hypothetical protein LMG31506_03464 [Cupriavidus yeoncheonensis]|uniref:Uncharacterized protein n=1 Tax=Cupriavidus yeoncheonensis TaxID=1462994 RepID=A0A916IWC2_9BURK|nr:hypothetical protein LMG31506_03464 [Cupriavidus yeoncheonensis]